MSGEEGSVRKQNFIESLQDFAEKADKTASVFSKAASDARVQAEGYWAIRDATAEFIRAAKKVPDEIYGNSAAYSRFLASDNAMRGVAASMDRVLDSIEDVGEALELSKFVVSSGASVSTSAIHSFAATAVEYGAPVPPVTLSRLETYSDGIGSPSREKVRSLLADVDPQFVHQYDEVWHTLAQRTPEGTLSASALMRQLVFWVLKRLAPDEVVRAQLWYQKPEGTDLDVARSQRVQYLFRGQSKSEEYVNALLTLIPVEMEILHGGVHRDPTASWDRGEVERAVHTLEIALHHILTKRTR